MARIGGRSTWFAWLVGIVCAGVVVGLVALAVPMAPAVFDWSGQALRGDLSSPRTPPPAAEPETAPDGDEAGAVPADCRGLYRDDLWAMLSTASGVQLREAADFPPTVSSGLTEALGAQVVLSCAWESTGDVSVTTTIAEVGDDATDTAARVLSGLGFACSPAALGVRCDGTADGGASTESHVIRSGLWVSTVERGWRPPGYADAVVAAVWPG